MLKLNFGHKIFWETGPLFRTFELQKFNCECDALLHLLDTIPGAARQTTNRGRTAESKIPICDPSIWNAKDA